MKGKFKIQMLENMQKEAIHYLGKAESTKRSYKYVFYGSEYWNIFVLKWLVLMLSPKKEL